MQEVIASRKSRIAAAFLVLAVFALVITVNALANGLPLNGVDTGTLSDEIPNLFVPAGITFSIWGLIYLLLAGFTAAVLIQAFSKNPVPGAWEPMDGLIFAVNGLANAGWIFAWHWRMLPLSLVIMLVLLVTLALLAERIYKRLSPGGALHSGSSPKAPALLRFALSTPIHVYLGWICVATIANVTALLVTLGWNGWGIDPRVWTVIVIAAGLAVALGFIFKRRGIAAPLVVVWAYAGIVIKRMSLDGTSDPAVWMAAMASAALILASLAVAALKRRKA